MKKILAVIAMAMALAACDKIVAKPPSFTSTDVTGLGYARDFKLTDHNGKPRSLADFRGKVVVMFFGFTQCPDVCPTTMAEMANVMTELGERSKEVQVLFVTVDPERDTQELLQQYVPAFHPSFIGLRGDKAATDAVAKEFKVFYAKVPGKTPGSYTMDHTAASFVFDKEGKVRLYVRPGQGPAAIAADIKQLL
ncbi:MAG TPA: SCO family protein [Telluria sp.]|nr:SCO family protein [Telluria sp.]